VTASSAVSTKAVAQDPHPDFLRLVVVGGGATGVEMAGALAELRVAEGTAFPELTNTETSVVLIEQGPDLLTAFVPKLRRYARKQLLRRGVEVRTDTAVKEVREDGVVIGDGTFLPANVVIWAAGVAIDTTLADWGLPRGRGGRVLVDENLEVEGLPGVYATGDVSIAKDPSEQVPQLCATGDPDRPALGDPDPPRADRATETAVPLQGQGHDGDDRTACGGCRHRPRSTPHRHARMAGLAGTAHRPAARWAQPVRRIGEPRRAVRGMAALDESHHRRLRLGD